MPFFKREKIKSIKLEEHRKSLSKPQKQGCEECGLYKECLSPKLPPSGNGSRGIYIIGEGQGTSEEQEGKQFIGETGQFLRDTIYSLDIGYDLDEDCILDNSIRCRATEKSEYGNIINRKPKNKEINICREKILSSIKEYKPEKILLLGKSALISFLGHKTNNIGAVSKWVGFKIPDQEMKAWVFPIYHPSYVYQNQDNSKYEQ
jgi:uracil-DNA glycosylase family 4